MKHATAVQRLRTVADACDRWHSFISGDGDSGSWLTGAYAYGPVLDTDCISLDLVRIAFVVALPPDELPWGVESQHCSSLAYALDLDKAPVLRRWRSAQGPVTNHEIRRPMAIWLPEGVRTEALDALAERRAGAFRLPEVLPAEQSQQTDREIARSAAHLRAVRDAYWADSTWRRAHRGGGRYPEHHLWEAVDGYLDLLDAREAGDSAPWETAG